jgi:hypothetical protein
LRVARDAQARGDASTSAEEVAHLEKEQKKLAQARADLEGYSNKEIVQKRSVERADDLTDQLKEFGLGDALELPRAQTQPVNWSEAQKSEFAEKLSSKMLPLVSSLRTKMDIPEKVADEVKPLPLDQYYGESEEAQDIEKQDRYSVQYTIAGSTLWFERRNVASNCVARFPLHLEVLNPKSQIVLVSRDDEQSADCISPQCSFREKLDCESYNQAIKAEHELNQRQGLTPLEKWAKSSDSLRTYKIARTSANSDSLLFTRLTNKTEQTRSVKATKDRRSQMLGDSQCSGSATVSFVLKKAPSN